MVTKFVYRCYTESLSDITPEQYVDALENELSSDPRFRSTTVEVEFVDNVVGESGGLTGVEGVDLPEDPVHEYARIFKDIAEAAFANACAG